MAGSCRSARVADGIINRSLRTRKTRLTLPSAGNLPARLMGGTLLSPAMQQEFTKPVSAGDGTYGWGPGLG
ncbi:hypothetical protein GCM10010411_72360 [Actinomadura fulvescens]|uniref:Uncharacterized protein n=1 Tax=Actinomadura fulvescens TaxID=46160 RepID=A0ABP6CPF5_9ACTN